jgi:hypothetical protein
LPFPAPFSLVPPFPLPFEAREFIDEIEVPKPLKFTKTIPPTNMAIKIAVKVTLFKAISPNESISCCV